MSALSRLGAAALLSFCATAAAQSVTLTLSPAEQAIQRGEAPRFEVVVRARERARMLDVARREDLRDKLLKPRISGGPDLDDLPVALLPLRAVGAGDYVTLEPNQSIAFEHHGLPLDLTKLAPGDYTVRMRFRTDWGDAPVESNAVRLRVR